VLFLARPVDDASIQPQKQVDRARSLLAITIKETIVRVYQDIRAELYIKYT
jgi:hypothetical protein